MSQQSAQSKSVDLKQAQNLAKRLSGTYFVDGKLKNASDEFAATDPATMQVIGQIARCTQAEADEAIQNAHTAQKEWSALSPRERGRMVQKCAESLDNHKQEIAYLMALETGKALRTECIVETNVYTDIYNFYAGLGSEIKGQTIPFNPKMLTMTVREPLGVVGAIIPWNVPLMLMALKVAPALVAGNTVVVKPSEEASLCVLRVAEIMSKVLPKGVLNILPGKGTEAGTALVNHPLIKKISFTGSVATGKLISKQAGERLVPATLELGGKSPMIIMEDADIDAAIDGAINGMRFTRQSQSCSASSRLFVHESHHDAVVDGMKERIDKMVMGDPLNEETDMGAIISKAQYDKVMNYIEMGKQEPGVTIHSCSALPNDPKFKDGLFVKPILITNISNQSRLAQEEIFGPVQCIIKWKNIDDAIQMANDTDFGLTASVWTKDIKNGLNSVRALEAGLVQINQNLVVQAGIPYGGFKDSGLGKEASLESMLEHYTKSKTIMVNLG